mmetsp:Transcript_11243/g.20545  ORF Transcript_11243/g.20545 Transcript_11243/m.20545 type:complete len:239 (+) Transcript_11243:632-1348(+)
MKYAFAVGKDPMVFSVSKCCAVSNNCMSVSEETSSAIFGFSASDCFKPVRMASRFLAMPIPSRCALSASASAAFTVKIFCASAFISDDSLSRACLFTSVMALWTSPESSSSVTKALCMSQPYAAMNWPSFDSTSWDNSSFCSKISSKSIFGTWARSTSDTCESTCCWTFPSLYTASLTRSGTTDSCTATTSVMKTLSFVLVLTLSFNCCTLLEMPFKLTHAPPQSKPAQFNPGPRSPT